MKLSNLALLAFACFCLYKADFSDAAMHIVQSVAVTVGHWIRHVQTA